MNTTVRMRDVIKEDRERLLAWRNSPEVATYMYSDHPIGRAEHDRWFDAMPNRRDRRYWIIEVNDEPVGLVNLADIDETHRRCAWAYYLASPSLRGLGVGSYVEFWAIEYVFRRLGFNKLWCEVLLSNEAVWKLHEMYGFRREALFRDHVIKGGRPADVVGLGLLARDWMEKREDMATRLRGKGYDLPA